MSRFSNSQCVVYWKLHLHTRTFLILFLDSVFMWSKIWPRRWIHKSITMRELIIIKMSPCWHVGKLESRCNTQMVVKKAGNPIHFLSAIYIFVLTLSKNIAIVNVPLPPDSFSCRYWLLFLENTKLKTVIISCLEQSLSALMMHEVWSDSLGKYYSNHLPVFYHLYNKSFTGKKIYS